MFLNRTFHLQETTRILLFGCVSITGIQTDMESSKVPWQHICSPTPNIQNNIYDIIICSCARCLLLCWDYLAYPHWLNVAITLVIQLTRYNPGFYRFVAPAVYIVREQMSPNVQKFMIFNNFSTPNYSVLKIKYAENVLFRRISFLQVEWHWTVRTVGCSMNYLISGDFTVCKRQEVTKG